MRWKDYKIARERMVAEQLVDRGISDKRVLEAMLRIPRHVFLDRDAGMEAYSDHSFPIGFSQTMSQPFMVAYLCEQLQLEGDETVLEVGSGSGYQAAITAALSRDVYTVERIPGLVVKARQALRDLLITNVTVLEGDGALGWPEYAPYDRVLLTAAARTVPKALLEQIRDGGIFVGPVEKSDGGQEIVRLRRRGNRFDVERLRTCSFVRLVREAREDDGPADLLRGRPYG